MRDDWFTGKYTRHEIEVTRVNKDGSFVTTITVPEYNRRYMKLYNNRYQWIASIDLTKNQEFPVPNPPRKSFDFPLWVGKKWKDDKFRGWNISKNKFFSYRNYYEVLEYGQINTEAGNFMAFKIWKINYNLQSQKSWNVTYWYSPEVKYIVKYRAEWGEKYDLLEFHPAP